MRRREGDSVRDIAKVKKLADKLIGTAGDTEIEDQVNELSPDELRVLDALAFRCVRCEWWFAAHERVVVNDEWMCDACADDAREGK
jgi:formylmethanofuran dehydrogenase subunit E